MDKQQNELKKTYFRNRNLMAVENVYDGRWRDYELTPETLLSNYIKPNTILRPYKISELMSNPEVEEYVKNNIEKFDDFFLVFMTDFNSKYADIMLPEFVKRVERNAKNNNDSLLRRNTTRIVTLLNKNSKLFNYLLPVIKYLNHIDINDVIRENHHLIKPLKDLVSFDAGNMSSAIAIDPNNINLFTPEELDTITGLYIVKILNRQPELIDAHDWNFESLKPKQLDYLILKQPYLRNHPRIRNLVNDG